MSFTPPLSPSNAVKFANELEHKFAHSVVVGLVAALKSSPLQEFAIIADNDLLRLELENIICDVLPFDKLTQKLEICCENECPSCWTRFCQYFGFCSKSKKSS